MIVVNFINFINFSDIPAHSLDYSDFLVDDVSSSTRLVLLNGRLVKLLLLNAWPLHVSPVVKRGKHVEELQAVDQLKRWKDLRPIAGFFWQPQEVNGMHQDQQELSDL